MSVENVAQRI